MCIRDSLIYLPKDYDAKQSKKWPVLVFLHGSGERGEDLNKLKVHGPPRLVNEGRDLPFVIISMPVSYTHLDVYKRQGEPLVFLFTNLIHLIYCLKINCKIC